MKWNFNNSENEACALKVHIRDDVGTEFIYNIFYGPMKKGNFFCETDPNQTLHVFRSSKCQYVKG